MRPTAMLTTAVLLSFAGACNHLDGFWNGIGHGSHEHGSAAGSGPSGAAGAGSVAPTTEPKLPSATRACPTLATGTIEALGVPVQLWLGQKRDGVKPPVLFYWHGTGSVPGEAELMLGDAFQGILDEGGLIVSPGGSLETGDDTGPGVWYTGDFAVSDEILACAIEQLGIDTHRIYTAGCDAGGLQAGVMAYERSGYLAAAIPHSGGTVSTHALQDAGHVTPVMATHGADDLDIVIVSFAQTSRTLTNDLAAKGGFAVICNHQGGHCASPLEAKSAQWQFLNDHPFGVSPEPYAAGLPQGFPTYCEIVK
jgi:poly(3-hydroxybutyrate) depolymerase